MAATAPIGGKPTPREPSRFGMTGSLYERAAQAHDVHPGGRETRELHAADRARRLAEWVAEPTGTWSLDILPILNTTHDDLLNLVLDGKCHPDALKALRMFVAQVDAAHQLGARALDRWMRARAAQGAKVGLHEAQQAEAS